MRALPTTSRFHSGRSARTNSSIASRNPSSSSSRTRWRLELDEVEDDTKPTTTQTEPTHAARTIRAMNPLKRLARLLLTALVAAAFAAPVALAAPVEYTLDPAASQARFLIGENLLGRENTAVGATNAVSGGVSVDGDDLAGLTFQPFVVDVSTLATDDRMRDNQIRNSILQTNRAGNATVTFAPSSVEGLELPLVAGTTQAVRLTGDLTIKGVTRTVVFDLDLEVVSAGELRGTASTVVKLTDFDIAVPRVPLVARVDEDVQLVLDFRLVAGQE